MTALESARNYIGSAFGPQYDAWLALDDNTAGKTLVSATRYIDSLQWQGTSTGQVLDGDPPTLRATSLSWPRTGVFVDGVELDRFTVPVAVVEATAELAVMFLAKPTLANNADTGSLVSSLGAGPASISFFRPTTVADGTATILPTVINRLIGRFLASSGPPIGGGLITGASAASNFRTCSCGSSSCSCGYAEQRPDRTWPL
jgi:hypothetical protein